MNKKKYWDLICPKCGKPGWLKDKKITRRGRSVEYTYTHIAHYDAVKYALEKKDYENGLSDRKPNGRRWCYYQIPKQQEKSRRPISTSVSNLIKPEISSFDFTSPEQLQANESFIRDKMDEWRRRHTEYVKKMHDRHIPVLNRGESRVQIRAP